jgi:hypothetical protein
LNEEKNEECISSPIHFDENLDESLSISPSDLVHLTTNVSTQRLSQTKKIIEIFKNEIIANLTKEPKCVKFVQMIKTGEIYENILRDMKIKRVIFEVHNENKNNNNSEITHDKYKTDNIIKKVLVFIFTCLIDKINSIMQNNGKLKNYKIKLNYEFKSRLKKDIHLILLDTYSNKRFIM